MVVVRVVVVLVLVRVPLVVLVEQEHRRFPSRRPSRPRLVVPARRERRERPRRFPCPAPVVRPRRSRPWGSRLRVRAVCRSRRLPVPLGGSLPSRRRRAGFRGRSGDFGGRPAEGPAVMVLLVLSCIGKQGPCKQMIEGWRDNERSVPGFAVVVIGTVTFAVLTIRWDGTLRRRNRRFPREGAEKGRKLLNLVQVQITVEQNVMFCPLLASRHGCAAAPKLPT